MKKRIITLVILILAAISFGQNDSVPTYKYSLGVTYLSFLNFGEEATNTHHYEMHIGYQLTPKDKISLKLATWKLFAPMGIPLWDTLFLDKREFFPGRLHETGIGITYQRILWKGLFATIEVLPLYKRYLDTNNQLIGKGFKLYTTYHLGYHIPIFKNRFFIEPQIHGNYWPIDTKAPQSFQEKENKWNNFFIFEPNLYLGVNF
ncbi:MAG: hypothetical protein JNL74_22100 [Fibrobacteres bacterium]|nr:hypothetical protein [Fibrobacterota bacterium]